ncbi:hypothetical protein LNQ49_22725 [Flavobacterium sp. F-65]|uniref:Lipoprotein n=1 Tax=Flavobacterium pisciphilum TaxID=2893755 RepID=A0ABS8N079_9FLAO|nr:hypothetical protein [Flavobacterium sp. F-65]MCC9074412.1 hypothetical protein [Flavobacterium sp. F-65]
MKIIKSKLVVILLCLIAFSSCKDAEKISDKEKEESKNTKENSDEREKTAIIFSFNNEDNTEIIKISGSDVSDEDSFLLVGDKNILIVSKYKKDKENLQLIQNDTLLVAKYNHVTIDPQHILRKKIQNVDYFLFALMESPLGNGDPGLYLSFIMLNMDTLKFYTLKYDGEPTLRSDNAVEGEFLDNTVLNHNITIKKELYLFAQKSKWIYTPSSEEKDINHYRNFEQKWHSDNYPKGAESFYPSIIKSTYYSENLFQYNGNYDNDEVIENKDFKIVTYFRNNIIGYDKNKKLYFPITVESCATGCDKKIEFVSENEIEISYEMNVQKTDTIDLNKIKFENPPVKI